MRLRGLEEDLAVLPIIEVSEDSYKRYIKEFAAFLLDAV